MSESPNQNSKIIFDGSKLEMTNDGPKYNPNRYVSLQDAFNRVAGGKKFSSLKEAFKDHKKVLREK